MDRERLRRPLQVLGIVAAVFFLAALILWRTCGFQGCPNVETLAGYVPEEASTIVDREGDEVAKLYKVNRLIVPLDSLPEHVAEAFIAIEDRRFWDHGGVDWRRVPGAFFANVKAAGIEEGFSTITMQLARNVFPEKLPQSERTVFRKLGEMRVARQIEDRYSKEEILEMYVNQIYFGSGAWGIQAAANEYFGKSARELTLAEAALLASLPRAPSRLNPRADPQAAERGRALVLERMAEQGMITREEADAAAEAAIELARRRQEVEDQAPYFVQRVRQVLEEQFGEDIYTGGFTIHTTLDLDLQRIAEAELQRQIRDIEAGAYGYYAHDTYESAAESDEGGSNYLQGAFVAMDPLSGDVLALVGGRDFGDSEFNRAVQARRQPGSAFKPFVYAAALQAGYPPTMVLEDQPYRRVLDTGKVWSPENYDGQYWGRTTLREALVHSRNIPTLHLAEQVGYSNIAEVAQNLGLGQELPRVPAMPLGVVTVSPLELTTAYAAFASLGQRPTPRLVQHVVDREGNVVWRQGPSTSRVIDPAVAFLVTDLLRDVVDRGTATAVRAAGFRGAVAGKTGTTNDATNVWFVGYTPEVVATVWIGLDEPARILPRATGGSLAAPVWGRALRRAGYAGQRGWSRPPGIVVSRGCPDFGAPEGDELAAQRRVREEYFLAGSAPAEPCWGDYAAGPYDSLPYGVGVDSLSDDESWWRRLRERLFSDQEARRAGVGDTLDHPRADTFARPPFDTVRGRPRPMPRRDTLAGPPPRPDPARRDTSPPDVLGRPADRPRRPPPDTSG